MSTPDSQFLQRVEREVLFFDGAMGTSIHAHALPVDDYRGLENCSEILNETRPDVIEQIHRSFLDVGSDVVETNTFGANPVVLAEYGLGAAYLRAERAGSPHRPPSRRGLLHAGAPALRRRLDRPRYAARLATSDDL